MEAALYRTVMNLLNVSRALRGRSSRGVLLGFKHGNEFDHRSDRVGVSVRLGYEGRAVRGRYLRLMEGELTTLSLTGEDFEAGSELSCEVAVGKYRGHRHHPPSRSSPLFSFPRPRLQCERGI